MTISRYTPYDATYYSKIPANFRFAWKRKTNRELALTDEEIFIIWRDNAFATPDDMDEDDYILELINDALDEQDKKKELDK